MRKLSVLLLAVLVLAAAAGCVASRSTAGTNWKIVTARDMDETLEFKVSKNYQRLTLKADIELTYGDLTFAAYDPEGNQVWTETLKIGQSLSQTKAFANPILGGWKVHIRGSQVEGNISFRWRGTR